MFCFFIRRALLFLFFRTLFPYHPTELVHRCSSTLDGKLCGRRRAGTTQQRGSVGGDGATKIIIIIKQPMGNLALSAVWRRRANENLPRAFDVQRGTPSTGSSVRDCLRTRIRLFTCVPSLVRLSYSAKSIIFNQQFCHSFKIFVNVNKRLVQKKQFFFFLMFGIFPKVDELCTTHSKDEHNNIYKTVITLHNAPCSIWFYPRLTI